ncbi:unnamed protein product [Soboliphyme baturini]|uniref:ubiquitinyl hydrolase 1 n=1 Tax=Soboliphyme baturini TaxID=241478 RepID=A0A183INS1_9BILA|nr:unnamed protein product [Soboliphyme baturini]
MLELVEFVQSLVFVANGLNVKLAEAITGIRHQCFFSMAEAWAELESDPGLFTLLLKDFGVQDVEVEEVYDLHSPLEGPSYGFIFLFKWLGNTRRSRHGSFGLSTKPNQLVTDEATLNSMFFAKQCLFFYNVPNSCATYALLNILLNQENVNLGETLLSLKEETRGLNPENFGRYGNCFRRHHHEETFHFASYLPINGHLYELDSLKAYPVDHGVIPESMEWTQFFQQIILDRFSFLNLENNEEEIRYNLMTLVPCKLKICQQRMEILTVNQRILWTVLENMANFSSTGSISLPAVRVSTRSMNADDKHQRLVNYVNAVLAMATTEFGPKPLDNSSVSLRVGARGKHNDLSAESVFTTKIIHYEDLAPLIKDVEEEIRNVRFIIKELEYRAKRYEIDDQRRVHDYDPFIRTFLSMLTSQKSNSS